MLPNRKVNRKRELSSDSNEAAGDISARDGARVPCVYEEENGLLCDADGVSLIYQYAETFVEVSIKAFDQHRVMIAARENMAVDIKQIDCFTKGSFEFTVLVEDESMAEPKAKHNFHDG
jgi:hypothetical protein